MNLKQNVSKARERERTTAEISMHSRGNELIPNYQDTRAEQCALRQNRDHPGIFRIRPSLRKVCQKLRSMGMNEVYRLREERWIAAICVDQNVATEL
jgi:hypothetical protein